MRKVSFIRQTRMLVIAGAMMLAMMLLTSFSGKAVMDIRNANPVSTSIERGIK